MSELSLQELGTEYAEQAKVLKLQIDARRKRLKSGKISYKETCILEHEIAVLSLQYCDAVGIGKTLMHYYDRESTWDCRRRNFWKF